MPQTDLRIQTCSSDYPGTTRPRSRFSVIRHDSIIRRGLEARIRSGFGTHFGACIEGFMPNFAQYKHASGATGVIGFRRASEDRLFLENYLSGPIEALIEASVGNQVPRKCIAEVGQFVIDDRDAVGDFFRDLAPFLVSNDFAWLCFTGTKKIRAILGRVGFHGLAVASADQKHIRHSDDHWGSYYDNEPLVIVGKLDDPQGRWCNGLNAGRIDAAIGA